MVRNYTLKRHIKRVRKMLKQKKPCNLCPAMLCFNTKRVRNTPWSNNPCIVCTSFINLHTLSCPCYELGKEEAIKRTLIALEEVS